MRIEFADDADIAPDVAVLTCGTWEMVTRLRGIENFRKTAGCDRMGPHDFVVEREVRSDFSGVVGWESIWKSRCCGIERRFGFTYEKVRA